VTKELPNFTEQLRQLIALPSVSCTTPAYDMGNRAVVELLAHWLGDLGFATEILDVPGYTNKANLIATLGTGPGGLVLAGHTDTVPCNPELWQQDPFTLTERDNRFYGLGATDMKGFFPVAIAAAQAFRADQLKQPLIILATADEESSMDGAKALVDAGKPKARYAVVGEPTGMRPIRMHKGMMMEAVRVEGRSGHSSDPSLGVNALEAMHLVMSDLLQFRGQMQERYNNPGFGIAVPTMNLGCIHGGDNPNRICGHCELHFDLRPLPGMDLEDLRGALRERLQPLAEKTGTNITLSQLFPGVPAFEQVAQSRLVGAAERLTGHTADSVAFATEAPFMQALGMETIVMGPGSIEQAHQPNEYIDQRQIQPAIQLLTDLIRQLCT
jgi:acetylornithine deacetylase